MTHLKAALPLLGLFLGYLAVFIFIDNVYPPMAHHNPLEWQWWMKILLAVLLVSGIRYIWREFITKVKDDNKL